MMISSISAHESIASATLVGDLIACTDLSRLLLLKRGRYSSATFKRFDQLVHWVELESQTKVAFTPRRATVEGEVHGEPLGGFQINGVA